MVSRKIIVVDDEVMVADVSKKTLTKAGHHIVCAHSGEQAVELAMESCFDLAIIDAMLPGMSGFETFELLRQSCPALQGILLSGDLTVNMTLDAMDRGFSRVLAKPVKAKNLVRAVQGALAEFELREENVRLRNQVVKIQTLFEQYMAPEVAAILLNPAYDLRKKAGKVEKITVMFADIRNFTFLVQHLSLQDSRVFLTEFFDIVADIVSLRHGTLDKFIGDAAMAVFGAPVPLDAPSLGAVSAAVDIQKAFDVLRLRWARKSELFMQIGLGIGISRGDMYLGNVGSGRRLDYTVVGADVNIAQRLASETVAGQILITESVYNDVADKVAVQKEKNRLLRGLEKQIRLYSITP